MSVWSRAVSGIKDAYSSAASKYGNPFTIEGQLNIISGGAAGLTDFAIKGSISNWNVLKYSLIPDMRRDRETMTNSATAARRIIYGRVRVGGSLVYAETSGDKNENLNIVVVFTGHIISGYDEIWFDDKLAATVSGGVVTMVAPFAGKATIELHDGTQTVASPQMLANTSGQWTAAHKLLGCAYAVIKMTYDESVYASGIPQIRPVIRGKAVYDPRTTITAYSTNPALCIMDYMRISGINGGMGCDTSEVSTAAILTAANICDEVISAAGGEKRYTMNGFISLDSTPSSIITQMLSALAGSALYAGGTWEIFAGAHTAAVATLDESWLNGGISFTTGNNKNGLINTAKTTFTNPADHWADTESPATVNQTYLTEDGEELSVSIAMPFTNSTTMAQRMAKMAIEKSRRGMTVSYPCNMKAADLNAIDTVAVNNTLLGWTGKLFTVTNWDFYAMGGVNLSLTECDANIYADPTVYGSLTPPALTSLPSPWAVAAPTGFTADEQLYSGILGSNGKSRLLLSWIAAEASGTLYDIAIDGKIIQTVSETSYTINDMGYGTFDIAVRAKNSIGSVSTWVTVTKVVHGANDVGVAVVIPATEAPTALSCVSKFLGIDVVVTTDKTRLDTSYIEIWAATTNDRNTAVQIGITKDGTFPHNGLNNAVIRYYWARCINVFGTYGAWYPSGVNAGISGTTTNEPSKVIQLMNSDITDTDVANYLTNNTPLLSLLDTRSMLFELGVVGAGVTATYKDALSQAASQMNANQTLLQYLNNTVAGLTVSAYSGATAYTVGQIVTYGGQTYQCKLASTGNLPTNTTYWTPISGLYEMVNTIQQNLDIASGTWTSTSATLTADVDALDNPTTGRVSIAETTINQHGTNITLQGSAITGPLALVAGSVTEPGVIVETVEDIPGLDITVSKTKIEMDSANNAILLQAAEISSVTGRTTAAEIAINGHTAAINLRATSADLSGQVDILSNMIGLKLNATGTVKAGLAIGYDAAKDKSTVGVLADTFYVSKLDGSGTRTVFTVGTINGASTVGISGDLLVDGSINARSLVADTLMTTFLNAQSIVAGSVASENIVGAVITGKTIQTASSGSRFVVSALDNYAHFYDADGSRKVVIGAGSDVNDGDCYVGVGEFGVATTRAGIITYGYSRPGIIAVTSTDYAGWFGGTTKSTPYGRNFDGKGIIYLQPNRNITAPSHTADIGALWVTAEGVLYIYSISGWQKVSSQ